MENLFHHPGKLCHENNGREMRSAKPMHRSISSYDMIIGCHYIYRGNRTYFYHGLLEAGGS